MRAIDPGEQSPRETYRLLTQLVVPRPIAWVSTLAEDGTRNVAPHSYFNIISTAPPVVHVTSTGEKDTLRNVRATGEFVVNIVTRELLEPMNLTSADFPPHEDEFDWAGLESAASTVVKPPRVAAAKAALECRLRRVLEIGNGRMIFGDVVMVHAADELWEDGQIPPERLDAVGRLGGRAYLMTDEVTRLDRPRWADLGEDPASE
jgi:flavin reductase (DIM6/NTAB) family NADH-FMN oxidoreductase RutF